MARPKNRVPRASRSSGQALEAAAARLRELRQDRGTPAPVGQAAVRTLLQAAVEWRESARAAAEAQALPPRPRPAFNKPPRLPTMDSPPARQRYQHALTWWASRYAWDVAEGRPIGDAATGLVHTALVGWKDPQPKGGAGL